jgi:mannose-6-phosphate isomerase-like protein (cupin superfamily)
LPAAIVILDMLSRAIVMSRYASAQSGDPPAAGAIGMKARTTAKPLKNPINLAKSPVHFASTGSIEPVLQRGPAHPGVEGRLAGEARMTKSPPHAGEMHPDGDELLYLIEGAVDLVLDAETGERRLALDPGQAFVVPRGVWHRVIVKKPCRLLYFTPGRSQVRWKRA